MIMRPLGMMLLLGLLACHAAGPAIPPRAVFPTGWRFRAGEPGAGAGRAGALRKYGTMWLAAGIAPAIRLAEEGWIVDSSFSKGLSSDSALLTQFEGKRVFYPGGGAFAAGARLVQPELAW